MGGGIRTKERMKINKKEKGGHEWVYQYIFSVHSHISCLCVCGGEGGQETVTERREKGG